MRRCLPVALAVLTCLIAAGCTSATSGPGPAPRSAAYSHYVAMGDSFTAAPYVPTTDLAGGCLRSDGNYPSLLAAELEVETFADVSCSGARTRDLSRRQHTFRRASVPPQFGALTPETDLVTLGIGGNDFTLFARLLGACLRLGPADLGGGRCAGRLDGAALDRQIAVIGDRVAWAIAQVRRRSPEARVLLVGYLRIVPDEGACPRRLPLAASAYRPAARVARRLNSALERAARTSGAGFVDMYAASEGHDVCADDPWVNGQRTDPAAALAFHPFPSGMRAVTDAILDQLGPVVEAVS